jgi:hypothetical protein
MQVEIKLKNYRCFTDNNPAVFRIGPGFTSFVGINNAGKSTLLKFFYEFKGILSTYGQNKNAIYQAAQNWQGRAGFPREVADPSEVFSNHNDRNLTISIAVVEPQINPDLPSDVVEITGIEIELARETLTAKLRLYSEGNVVDVPGGANWLADGTLATAAGSRSFDQICNVLNRLADTLYIGPFRNTVNVGALDQYYDIMLGEAIIKHWRELKTGDIKKNNKAAIRLTSEIKGIFGFNTLEINTSRSEKDLQFTIDGNRFTLGELGSGLAEFFVTLTSAAAKNPSYILIDEPELHLHPALQLDFLTTLGTYAKEGVLFATHSLGLARASSEVRYSIHPNDQGVAKLSPYELTPSLPEFLGELGYAGYRELGNGSILLVEGPTEVKTMQQFLRKLKMEHKVVLVPIGGRDIINAHSLLELQELARVGERVYVLIDSEKTNKDDELSPGRQKFIENCAVAGIKSHVLTLRATENYLTDRALKAALGGTYEAISPYAKVAEAVKPWSKSENWRVAREMTKDELLGTDLGAFLAEIN